MEKLVLASASPRRRSLLENYGFELTVAAPDFDERGVDEREPEALVKALARGKNAAVRDRFPGLAVLSADTVVAIDGEILGKPRDRDEAFAMLRRLSGSTHTVYTGVCIYRDGRETVFCESTDVTFYELSGHQIEKYVDSGRPFDKAGGYGVQDDMGVAFVNRVDGELSNVIGLPMQRTIRELTK